MGTLLKVVGGFWALIGFGNLVMSPWTTAAPIVLGLGLMFNVICFVLPGLVVAGIGSVIGNKIVN